MLRLTFLVFPAVSRPAFQGFSCDAVRKTADGTVLEAYMKADLSVACDESRGPLMAADPAIASAIFATIGIYTCGVPLMYAFLFWKARNLKLQSAAVTVPL